MTRQDLIRRIQSSPNFLLVYCGKKVQVKKNNDDDNDDYNNNNN